MVICSICEDYSLVSYYALFYEKGLPPSVTIVLIQAGLNVFSQVK